MSCRTKCSKTILLVLTVFALAIVAVPASGQVCIQDAYNAFNGSHKTLSCTANDVSTAAVKQGTVNVFKGGIPGTNQCIAGGPFSFTAEFEIKTTSSSSRSNIGIFFGTGSLESTPPANQNGALTGVCSNSILTPGYACGKDDNNVFTATCGSTGSPTGYEELDGGINGETSPTGCGDTSSNDSTTAFGAGTQAAVLEVDGATCPLSANACPVSTGLSGNCLALPTCTGWYQPTTTMPVCNSTTHQWVSTAVPGTSSKCECGIVYVPIQPITITPIVQKACTTTKTGGPATFDPGPPIDQGTQSESPTLCDAGAEGSTVTYTVAISNTSNVSTNNAVVDQICDSQYGQIFRATTFTGPTCPAALIAGAATSNCPPGGTTGITSLTTATCTFTAPEGENASVTDTVTTWGHSSLNSSSTWGGTTGLPSVNSVTVTSSDAPTTAKTNKAVAAAPTAACVTARFSATVTNTSAADENINLVQTGTLGQTGYVSALEDSSFGDITTTHGDAHTQGSVTGTTCGIATTASGSGTASNASGAGTFPQPLAHGTCSGTGTCPPTSNGGSYTCQFDGVVCGTPGAIFTGNPPVQVCPYGLQNLDTVTANLTGDDTSPNADTITETANQFTANICLTITGQ